MINLNFSWILILSLTMSTFARAEFLGELKFTQVGCEKVEKCVLKESFGFQDANGYAWQADAGNETDGASIPKWLQKKFGKPFDRDILKAAVIHDHYCDRQVRSWWKTHEVFYQALRASGVKEERAKLMFLGVLIGGPKWIWVIEGKKCELGKNCTNVLFTKEKRVREIVTVDKKFLDDFSEVAQMIKDNSDISLEDIYAQAKKRRPEDFYLAQGDKLELDLREDTNAKE